MEARSRACGVHSQRFGGRHSSPGITPSRRHSAATEKNAFSAWTNANFIRFPSRRRPLLFLGFRDPCAANHSPFGELRFHVPDEPLFALRSLPQALLVAAAPSLSLASWPSPTFCTTLGGSKKRPPRDSAMSRIERSLLRSRFRASFRNSSV